MHSSRVAVCALVVVAGSALGQSPAPMTMASSDQTGPSSSGPAPSSVKVAKCPSAASAADNCASPDENTNRLPDLSPTQWIFGTNQFQKLTQPSFHSVTMTRARMQDLPDMQPVPTAVSPEYAALLRLLVPPPTPDPTANPGGASAVAVRNLTPAEERAVRAQANRYLVEEWRQSQLGVADSVHHNVLLRIGATFDSGQAAGVTGNAQRDLLVRLDRLIRANEYSWLYFRAQVNVSADSANAATQR